jgi:hypothetical protein
MIVLLLIILMILIATLFPRFMRGVFIATLVLFAVAVIEQLTR